MRVITGVAKGRPLKTVKSRDVRPTGDRVKESLFNVIGPRVGDADFLDLFAGSGNVGIEALSRGARSCTFVELMTPHLKIVEENLTTTGLRDRAQLLRRDARAAATDLGQRGQQFDLIFVDPPYGKELVPASLEGIGANRLLREDGWVICEHHRRDSVPESVPVAGAAGSLIKFRELIVGETVLSLYREEMLDGRQPD